MFCLMPSLKLEVWSDIACPWCYVGKRRLEGALKQFAHASQVELIWRAFELDPGAKAERPRDVSHVEFIARKYGMSVAQAQKSTDHLVELARAEGLSFDFVNIRSGNTFDAHRLVHLGHERGVQDAVQERMMKAYFEQAQLMSDHGTLVRLAGEAGLDPNEVTDLLAGDTYAAAVRADEARGAGARHHRRAVFRLRSPVCGERRSVLRGPAECSAASVVATRAAARSSLKVPCAGLTAAEARTL